MKQLAYHLAVDPLAIANNAWVVGVGTGILSGIAVAYVSRWIFSRKNNREYNQLLQTANSEVIYALRPSIAETGVPDVDIIEALIGATARKYHLPRKDLMSVAEVAEALIKEVLDSSFISAQRKLEYCQSIVALKARQMASIHSERSASAIYDTYRSSLTETFSSVLGVGAGLMTLLVSILTDANIHDPTFLRSIGSFVDSNSIVVSLGFAVVVVAIELVLVQAFPGARARLRKLLGIKPRSK